MKGLCLHLYLHPFEKHKETVLHQWLFHEGKKEGLERGAIFKTIAGYGEKTSIEEEHFFELGSNVPIAVVFISSKEKITGFLEKLKSEKIKLFYTMSEVEYGSLL